MPCRARKICGTSRLGRVHQVSPVSPGIVPFSPSNLRKGPEALGTWNKTTVAESRQQINNNGSCRGTFNAAHSFASRIAAELKIPPTSPPVPRGRHYYRTSIYPPINIKQIASHVPVMYFSNLVIEASPRARLHNRDRHRVGQVGIMWFSPAADGR